MSITHGWTSAATPDGSDVTPTNMNDHTIASDTVTEAQLSIADNTTKDVSTSAHGFVPKAPNDTSKFLRGDATWASIAPRWLQSPATHYSAGATTNAVTVSVATGALVCFVHGDSRGASSITQTNVTWTKLYGGNSSNFYFEVWAGAKTGAAGTTVTANFASSTQSYISVCEYDHAEFTTAGTAATATNSLINTDIWLGPVTVTPGRMVVFGDTGWSTDLGVGSSSQPAAWTGIGGLLMDGAMYAANTSEHAWLRFNGASGKFGAILEIY